MPTKILDAFVSVVFVFDEGSHGVSKQIRSLTLLLKKNYANYEILVIDNGLSLAEKNTLPSLLKELACIRIVRLSKVLDIDTSVFAGVEAAIGDYVCVLYNNDPITHLPEMVNKLYSEVDIVFGVATNLKRKNFIEHAGARAFYWYNRKFLKIDIPHGATYYMAMNRSAVNALTRSGRYSKHIRYLSKQIGFRSENYPYKLPAGSELYTKPRKGLLLRAINLMSSYSSHPLRAVTYFGVFAGVLNLIYAGYVVIVQLLHRDVAEGWTTLSLQASLMFFFIFMILAMLSEYIGQILEETRNEPPYHIQQELSSTISFAHESRRNVSK